MRRSFEYFFGLVMLLFSMAALAQAVSPVPGTWDQPLVTTPILTLGNGLTTGPVISDGGSVGATSPGEISSVLPSAWSPDEEEPAAAEHERPELTFAPSDSASALGPFAISLGDLARSIKGNHSALAHKQYTNSDIQRITAGDVGRTGIIDARTSKGTIAPRNSPAGDFDPETGIANIPDRAGNQDPALANGATQPTTDPYTSRPQNAGSATTPALDSPQMPDGDNTQLPAGEPTQD